MGWVVLSYGKWTHVHVCCSYSDQTGTKFCTNERYFILNRMSNLLETTRENKVKLSIE